MRLALFAAILVNAGLEPAATLRELTSGGTLYDLRWPNFSPLQTQVAGFYESTEYALAWVHHGAPTPQAKALIRMLQNASAKGLDAEDYDGSRWAARLICLRPASPRPSDADLVRFDLALTVSVMRYMSDIRIGKVNPKLFCFGHDVGQKKCDQVEMLPRLVDANDVQTSLEQLEPPFDGYRRTEQALQTYLKLAREDDGEILPATKKPVDPGDSYPGTARLERLLRLLGDLPSAAPASAGSQTYQGPLVDAVKHFQKRHGLDPDARIGKTTLAQLNTPLSHRVRQLQFTLERWRWVPTEFPRPPIVVNIPEFRLRAFNNRYEADLDMKVVVGGAYRHQTPVFTNNMTHVIFRPYWNVPLSIQRAELVPKIRNDPAYLAKNDYEIRNSRGELIPSEQVTEETLAELRSGKISIRQIPGEKNALGHIKFMFPNEYNVYLHGTPAKALFSRSRRDFSHGCIRVEKPEELAAWVLRDRPQWTLDRIREAENGAKPLQVNLDKPIPVLIVYATAVVDASGTISFFDDIYKHDAELGELFDKGYPYSDWKPNTAVRGQRPHERN